MAAPASSRVGSLPVSRTRLIGRETERAIARSFLLDEAVPLLTLTGPGGSGKTRLALAIAAEMADRFADGIAWVDLAPVTDPSLVTPETARALGIVPAPDVPLQEHLAGILRPRQLLLLVDNCEHVLPEAAALIAGLLAACPALQVLATSRAPLHIRGEQEVLVDPLPLPPDGAPLAAISANDAVQLFAERARAVHPSFTLNETNAADVAEICRRLDGLPLAIELAAAHVRALPLAALNERLHHRLPLLEGGPRDAPARQRTVRDTIAWSYDLLTPADRAAFSRLAVFVGGFTLDAARAIVGDDREGDAFPLLERLVEQHLVRLVPGSDEARYTMLETIREFGLERLAASREVDVIRGRHAAWCLELAEQAEIASRGGPEQAHWLGRLEAEFPNLREALGWLEETGDTEATLRLASALSGFWFWRSHRVEGTAWLERALAAADPTPTVGRGKALRALAILGMQLGSTHAATYAAESVAVWTELGDARRAADARLSLGQILEYQTHYERAIPLLEEAAREWDALGDPARAAIALYFLGQAALDHEDGPRADALFEEALFRFRQGGYAWGVSGALLQLGEVAAMRGDATAAAAYYAESLTGSGSREDLVGKLVAAGRLAATGGHAEMAARVFGAAAALADTIGYVRRPPEQQRLDRAAAVARASLGDAGFEAAWAAGQELRDEQAVAEARAELAAIGAAAAPSSTTSSAPEIAALTPRERDVLALVCERLTDPQIAERLFLSPRTVESHVSSILGKLGVENRRDAAAAAVRLGLV